MIRARELVSAPLQLAQVAVLVASLFGTAALVPRVEGSVPMHWGPGGIDRWGVAVELFVYPLTGLAVFAAEWALVALLAGAVVPDEADPSVREPALAWKRASARLLETTLGVLLAAIVVFGLATATAALRGTAPSLVLAMIGFGATLAPLVLLSPRAVRAQRALEARVGERVGTSLGEGQAGLVLVVVVGLPIALLVLVAVLPTLGG